MHEHRGAKRTGAASRTSKQLGLSATALSCIRSNPQQNPASPMCCHRKDNPSKAGSQEA